MFDCAPAPTARRRVGGAPEHTQTVVAMTIMSAGAKSPVRRHVWQRAALWAIQSIAAASLAADAAAPVWNASEPSLLGLLGAPMGSDPCFGFALAVVGLVGAIALLDIDTAGVAAAALSGLSVAAIVMEVVRQANPAPHAALFAATFVIAWTRRNELRSLVSRVGKIPRAVFYAIYTTSSTP